MRTPDAIAVDFNAARKRADTLNKQFAAAIREMGELLGEAEKILAPIDWRKWLLQETYTNQRLAQHYIEAAQESLFEIEQRAVRGALNICLSDEIIVPDAHHVVRAHDIYLNRLLIWASKDGSGFYVMAFNRAHARYKGNPRPIKREFIAEAIAETMRGIFEIANASYETLPADEKDIAALNDMRVRHLDKIEEDAA